MKSDVFFDNRGVSVRQSIYLVILVVALVSMVACDRGWSSLSVDPSTELKDLNTRQATAFCSYLSEMTNQRVAEYFDGPLRHSSCLISGMVAADFSEGPEEVEARESACQKTYDECMAQESVSRDISGECPELPEWSNCQATVEELEACIAASLDEMSVPSTTADFSCADLATAERQDRMDEALDRADEEREAEGDIEVAECAPIYEKCPYLF